MTKTLTVFCGARPGVEPHYQQVARQLGQDLAKQQIHLVYGGGGFGLMGALANGALDAGGQVTGGDHRRIVSPRGPTRPVDQFGSHQ